MTSSSATKTTRSSAPPCSTPANAKDDARHVASLFAHSKKKAAYENTQPLKGNTAHIGVDAHSGVVHSLSATGANVADIAQTHALLHGQEQAGYADAGYLGVEKREEIATRAPGIEWHVAAKRSKVRALPEGRVKELTRQLEKLKAQVRALCRASLSCDQESLPLSKDSLPGFGQEPRATL